MAAADVLIETLIDWGVDVVFRPARGRYQRPDGIAPYSSKRDSFCPGEA